MTTYRFLGRVIDQTTHLGLPGLRVEAWDAEDYSTDLVAFALTDAQGAFTLSLDDAYLRDLFQDRSPAIAFRLFSTGASVHRLATVHFLWNLVDESTIGRLQVAGNLTAPTARTPADHPASSVIRGTVLTAAGAAVAATNVNAFDQGLVSETLLGTATTDAGGQYQITYTPTADAAARPSPDIVVRAYAADGTVLVESARVCQGVGIGAGARP